MLVLTRKSNQSIMIGDDIEVSVLAIMGEKVRIGIQAPRDVPVFRKEVYLEIKDEATGDPKDARDEVDAALRSLGEDAPSDASYPRRPPRRRRVTATDPSQHQVTARVALLVD